jgi:general secretion pathway protein M
VKEWIARLRGIYRGLSSQERILVSAAAAGVAAALVFLLIVSPVLGWSARSEQRVATAEQELELVRRLRREYDEVHGRLATVEERIRNGPRGEIFTTLEKLAAESVVKVDSMEPRTSPASDAYRETKVQVALKNVTLTQLVNYLHKIDSSDQVLSIKSLRIRTRKDKPDLLDATFTVSSFEPA